MCRYDEAIFCFKKALTIEELRLGEEHFDTAHGYYMLGDTYSKKGESKNALFYYKRSLQIMETQMEKEDPLLIHLKEVIEQCKQKCAEENLKE